MLSGPLKTNKDILPGFCFWLVAILVHVELTRVRRNAFLLCTGSLRRNRRARAIDGE